MVDVDENEDVHTVDTVPPPADGDAYSAQTVVREAPSEVLDAIRKRRDEMADLKQLIPPSPPLPDMALQPISVTTPVAPMPAAKSEVPARPPVAPPSRETVTVPPPATSWLDTFVSRENRSPVIALFVGVLLFVAAAYVLATSGPAH